MSACCRSRGSRRLVSIVVNRVLELHLVDHSESVVELRQSSSVVELMNSLVEWES